jgi:mannitol/fructose-specific phosphotransferase system IIA component (Ntr-type)
MADVFSEAVARCGVRLDPAARDMAGLVGELIGAAVAEGLLPAERQQEALDAVLRREQSASTVLPDGISFPHGRIDGLAHAAVVLGVHRLGVDLGAPDGQLTCLTVLMLVPAAAGASHVQMLARFSRKLLDPAARARLQASTSAADVRQILVS